MASGKWFGIVKKKLLTRKKSPGKNIIIIHNNTSITSQEEDNRTSCVEISNNNEVEIEKMADADVISADMMMAPSVDSAEEAEEVGEKERRIDAAVRIQSFFRGHLARRAFRALRSLVKLQAVVRGVCVRKQAWIALRCMHALVRLQDRLRSRHLLITKSIHHSDDPAHSTMHIHSA